MNVRRRSGLMGEVGGGTIRNAATQRHPATTQAKKIKNTVSAPKATGPSKIKGAVSGPRGR